MIIFIGDLHIGCGDVLDDFFLAENLTISTQKKSMSEFLSAIDKMHKVFDSFLEYILSIKKGEKVEVILLGDIFDCLQIQNAEYGSPQKIDLIKKSHSPFFESLNNFIKKGGEVTYVIGNHDKEMAFSECFERLKSIVPQLNEKYDGKPIHYYRNTELSLYAEHGNQSDPFNRFKNPLDPKEIPIGSLIVQHIVNNFEKEYPLIDNLQGAQEILWLSLKRLPGFLNKKFRKQITALLKSKSLPQPKDENDNVKLDFSVSGGEGAILEKVLNGQILNEPSFIQIIRQLLTIIMEKGKFPDLPSVKKGIVYLLLALEKCLRMKANPAFIGAEVLLCLSDLDIHPVKILREVVDEHRVLFAKNVLFSSPEEQSELIKCGNLIGRPPEKFDIFILAHHHKPSLHQWGDKTYANTGSWKPIALPVSPDKFRLSQTFDFILVRKDNDGEVEVKKCNFRRSKAFRNISVTQASSLA